ncbi:MAG: fibronectin type III domain-containing protein [Gemmatimonadetes bacterium]|nr:fibronectin type III domain-containing protein [Gemmatimonadota bacterium]
MRLNASRLLALSSAALLGGLLTACSSSDSSTTPTPTPPSAPSGVTAAPQSATTMLVTWNQVSGATGYDVDRAEGSGSYANVASGLTTTAYTDTGLSPSTTYNYVVRAKNSDGASANSSAASGTTEDASTPGPKIAYVTGLPLDRTFYSDTLYVLQGYVKVSNGSTLTIQPGTKIVGDTMVAGSSLWILRGSKIMAEGTADQPIVFTSERSPGNRKPGDWGGLIIIGNALINRHVSPIFTEGPVGAAEDYSGGTDYYDNSGSLKYVRVEFAGYDVSNGGGQELNSISNYAVGRGTQMDYIEVMAGLDDGIENFGGECDYRHVVSWNTGDDHFDWGDGVQARLQYFIAIQTQVLQPRPGTGTVSSDPRGFEGDGCEIDKAGCQYTNTPYSMPVLANFTVIGPGDGVFATTDGNGAVIRRGSTVNMVNGIIGRWPGVGISLRDQEGLDIMAQDSGFIHNVVLAENGSNFEPVGKNLGSIVADSATVWNVTESTLADLFAGTLPLGTTVPTDATLGIELKSGSPAATGGLASFTGKFGARVQDFFGAAMPATAYIGAADPSASTGWWMGWTYFANN